MNRSIVAALATSVLVASAHAQCPLSFAPAVSYATAGNMFSLTVADLNNDGLQDVVVGYALIGQVSVFLNQGGGTLGARTDFPTGTTAPTFSVEAADFNADGFRDLVCGTSGGGVRILFNNGSGGFGAAVAYGGSADVRQVAIGDIDGNGTPDVVAGDTTAPQKVLPFLNTTGTGVLTPGAAVLSPVTVTLHGVALVNDDNDSDLDILFSLGGTNGLYRAQGVGNGTFQTPTLVVGGAGGTFITLADVTGDGRPDVFIPNQAAQGVLVCTNTGPGAYASAGLVSVLGGVARWSCAVADVNGDGVKDILDPRSTPARVGVALGLGGTSFAAPVDLVTAGGQGSQVEVADLNNDGRIDAVMVDYSSPQVFVFMNTAAPVVTGPVSTAVYAGGTVTFTVTAPTATSFQWRRNGVPLTEGGHFSGVTTATLTVMRATDFEFGSYDCVVTGCSGGTTTSSLATLAVNNPCPADLDNGTGAGTPDGGVDINDLLYFLEHFESGC